VREGRSGVVQIWMRVRVKSGRDHLVWGWGRRVGARGCPNMR